VIVINDTIEIPVVDFSPLGGFLGLMAQSRDLLEMAEGRFPNLYENLLRRVSERMDNDELVSADKQPLHSFILEMGWVKDLDQLKDLNAIFLYRKKVYEH